MSYALYIGSDLCASGHGWLAGYGDEPSGHWLEVVPCRSHSADSTITVGVTAEAALPGQLSTIPQVPRTARYMGVNYSHYLGAPPPLINGGVNQHGVAVRASLCATRPARAWNAARALRVFCSSSRWRSNMPARSEAQQKAAGAALSAKRGDAKVKDLKGASKEMYDDMSESKLEDFAKTKRADLPEEKD